VVTDDDRQRQRAVIEQVDEIGPGAKSCVDSYRIGGNRGLGGVLHGGWREHDIDFGKQGVGQALVLGQPVAGIEEIDRAWLIAAGDDLARYGVQGIGTRFNEFAYRMVALGHPRPS